MKTYDCIIIGTGPAGLGAAFRLSDQKPALRVLIIDKEKPLYRRPQTRLQDEFYIPGGVPGGLLDQQAGGTLSADGH